MTRPGSGGELNIPVPDSWCVAEGGGGWVSCSPRHTDFYREHTTHGNHFSNAQLSKHFPSCDPSACEPPGDESSFFLQEESSKSDDASRGADASVMQRE